jgi:anti-sigma regulatory factor (Ser/Thr protein kinase)
MKMATSPDALLQLQVPPQADVCGAVRERIVAFARGGGVAGDDLSYFLAAVGEALANAIEHSFSVEPILIECRISRYRIVARIEDHGLGFASEPSPTPELPEPMAERGRGLAIIRRCSDIYSLTTHRGEGTTVTVGRYLHGGGHDDRLTA